MHCKQCGHNNHNTPDCIHLSQIKCSGCRKFSHTSDECWGKEKTKRKREDDDGKTKKKKKKTEVNEAEEEEEEEEIITLNTEEVASSSSFFDPSKEVQYFNFNIDNSYNRG